MAELRALKYWRQRRALTQEELGALTGIPQTTIARIEGRLTARPSTTRKLAEALNVTIDQLLGEDRQEPGEQRAAA